MRTRAFEQDDAHVFCRESDVQREVARFIELLSEKFMPISASPNLTSPCPPARRCVQGPTISGIGQRKPWVMPRPGAECPSRLSPAKALSTVPNWNLPFAIVWGDLGSAAPSNWTVFSRHVWTPFTSHLTVVALSRL